MTPADELTQAADKLDAQTNGACPCLRCKIDRALAEWLHDQSSAAAVRNGHSAWALEIARLINGSAS